MAGGDSGELKGIAKIFNSTTQTGRANTTKATYAVIAVIGLYFYLKPKKQAKSDK